MTITVYGTCTENVTITRDDVVIQGSGSAGVTAASSTSPVIRLDGARRIRITGLTLTGGDSGVQGSRGSTFDVSSCVVQGGARFGVLASNGSIGTVDGCVVAGSGGQGVIAANESAIYVTNSTVENHAAQGVSAVRASHVRVGQDINASGVLKAVTVRFNGSNGISITDSSAGIVVGGTVHDNGNSGIFVGRASTAQIGIGSFGLTAGVTVQNNTRHGIAVESSQATILGSTITANDLTGIIVSNAAGARIGITDGNTAYVGNTISNNGSNGIHVVGSSSAFIGGNTVTGNGTTVGAGLGRNGIGVFSGSVHLAGANVIANNAGTGVFVSRNSGAFIGDPNFGLPVTGTSANQIAGNGALDPSSKGGVFAFEGGSVEIRDAVVSGNFGGGILAFMGGIAEVRRTNVTGSVNQQAGPNQLTDFNGGHGVLAGMHSVVRLRGPLVVTGNQGVGVRVYNASGLEFRNELGAPQVNDNTLGGLDCGGGEASFVGDVSGVSSIAGGCTGF